MEYKHLLYSLFVCILQVEKGVVLLCLPLSRGSLLSSAEWTCDKGVKIPLSSTSPFKKGEHSCSSLLCSSFKGSCHVVTEGLGRCLKEKGVEIPLPDKSGYPPLKRGNIIVCPFCASLFAPFKGKCRLRQRGCWSCHVVTEGLRRCPKDRRVKCF